MPQQEKWAERQWDMVARLLDSVRVFLPETECTLLADRGLAGAPLVRLCRQRQWHYVLRICQEHTCRRQLGKHNKWSQWCSFKSFIHKKGQQWYGRALVWQEETLETFVSACWEEEYQEAWLIISDLPAGKKRLETYALRMRVESTFQDTCDPWLEHRSRPTQSAQASGTLALSPVSGGLVGGSFGRFLHSSWSARPL